MVWHRLFYPSILTLLKQCWKGFSDLLSNQENNKEHVMVDQ